MSELDMSNVRDFAMFMALTSNNQGKNGERALANFKTRMGNSTWSEMCQVHWKIG